MINFGDATPIMGMGINRNLPPDIVRMSHEQCTKELLEKYGMLDNNPSPYSMSSNHYCGVDFASPSEKAPLSPAFHETFRAILSSVNFMCKRRTSLSQSADAKLPPSYPQEAIEASSPLPQRHPLLWYHVRLMRPYLRTTTTVFSISDRAADTSIRRSRLGGVVMLNGGAINWASKQQACCHVHH
jgi:hypothetical protein